MKALKPSARQKRRYLFIEGDELDKNIEKAVMEFTGVLGMAKAGIFWIEKSSSRAIIAVNRDSLNYVRASFAAYKGKICVRAVSGTLKKLRQKIIDMQTSSFS